MSDFTNMMKTVAVVAAEQNCICSPGTKASRQVSEFDEMIFRREDKRESPTNSALNYILVSSSRLRFYLELLKERGLLSIEH